jgi:hypothetical protein
MLRARTLKFLGMVVGAYVLLLLPALLWPHYLDSAVGIVVAIPYLSIYLFNGIGIPGLLQNDGACGFGWCAPTLFGWIFLCAFWLLLAWLVAWSMASLTKRAS